MSAQFDALAQTAFDWRDYLDRTPRLRHLSEEIKRDMVATWLQEHVEDLHDVFSYISDYDAVIVAKMIAGNVDDDMRREFDQSLYDAALAALTFVIDDRIELLYENYVQEYGRFSDPDLNGPAELIGWRNPNETF